jgi:hypothetical protein
VRQSRGSGSERGSDRGLLLTGKAFNPDYPPARRHVVVARTKGTDTISSVNAEAIRAIAERSDALFHVVLMETPLDNDAELRSFQCANMGLCWPTRTFWTHFIGSSRPVAPGIFFSLTGTR